MARFVLFRLPGFDGYVLDVQTDLIDRIETRAIVPLRRHPGPWRPVRYLNPVFEIDGVPHVMVTQEITSVLRRQLRQPVGTLREHHDAIIAALDALFLGY